MTHSTGDELKQRMVMAEDQRVPQMSDSAVAVRKRMDELQFVMHDGGLNERVPAIT